MYKGDELGSATINNWDVIKDKDVKEVLEAIFNLQQSTPATLESLIKMKLFRGGKNDNGEETSPCVKMNDDFRELLYALNKTYQEEHIKRLTTTPRSFRDTFRTKTAVPSSQKSSPTFDVQFSRKLDEQGHSKRLQYSKLKSRRNAMVRRSISLDDLSPVTFYLSKLQDDVPPQQIQKSNGVAKVPPPRPTTKAPQLPKTITQK